MVAGFDRYFQIAPCFRDEDPRADRLPGEFYQLDLEMSFVTQEEIWETMEPVMAGRVRGVCRGPQAVTPAGKFPRIPYAQAMLDYGTDKPDLRNPLVITRCHRAFHAVGLRPVREDRRRRRRGPRDPGAGHAGQEPQVL